MTREEALADITGLRGPPYRMTIEFSPPVLTKEEEAAELAQAEYDDDMGNFAFDPECYTTLCAQNVENAKREAEARWRSRPPDDAIGYAIWRADWGCVYSVRVTAIGCDRVRSQRSVRDQRHSRTIGDRRTASGSEV